MQNSVVLVSLISVFLFWSLNFSASFSFLKTGIRDRKLFLHQFLQLCAVKSRIIIYLFFTQHSSVTEPARSPMYALSFKLLVSIHEPLKSRRVAVLGKWVRIHSSARKVGRARLCTMFHCNTCFISKRASATKVGVRKIARAHPTLAAHIANTAPPPSPRRD